MNIRSRNPRSILMRRVAIRAAWFLCVACLTPRATHAAVDAADFHDRREVKTAAEEILSSTEFRHLERLEDALEEAEPENEQEDAKDQQAADERESQRSWFKLDALGAIGSAAGAMFHGLAWGLLAVVCVLILYLVARALSERLGDERLGKAEHSPDLHGEAEPERAPGEHPADVYVTRARELAAGGSFREAVAQLLLGGMSHIERAGWIRFRRGLTYRDYLRAVRGEMPVHSAMNTMIQLYEPLGFGRREATREIFERSLEGYQAGFHAAQAALAH